MSPISSATVPRRSTRIVSRIVSGEHILVPLASRGVDLDSIFNLNPTGTFIWEQIDGIRTLSDIEALVVAEFGVEPARASTDCEAFLEQLLEARAIEIGS